MFGRVTKSWVQSAIAAAVGNALECYDSLRKMWLLVDNRIDKLRSDFAKEVAAMNEQWIKDSASHAEKTHTRLDVLYRFCGLDMGNEQSILSAKVGGFLPVQIKNRLTDLIACFNAVISDLASVKHRVTSGLTDHGKAIANLEADIKALRESNERLAQRVGFLHARMNRQLGDNPDCELNLAEVALVSVRVGDRTDMLAAVAGGEFVDGPKGSGELLRIGYQTKKPNAPKKKERKRK